ncbi:MAG: SIS domain-containing protein [Rhodobacteraceae bacterium]|nr:SIS domain-containing protein [Paracoccaceae bacterium]
MNQYQIAISELSELFERVDGDAVDTLVSQLMEAKKIVVFGAGRERLQIMGLAMRLFHLGLDASVVGDMNTPAVGKQDLFLVTCGPGVLSTVTALANVAREAGATIVMITAKPDGLSIQDADITITIPAQTMADDHKKQSVLPMGSLFEGALFILFEVVVMRLKENICVSSEVMRSNHTNLE